MLNRSIFSLVIFASLQISGAFSFGSSNSRRAFVEQLTTAATVVGLVAVQPVSVSAADALKIGGNIKFAGEEIMSPKEHGTSAVAVQENLRYGVSRKQADKICNFNRHFAESSGYFRQTSFEDTLLKQMDLSHSMILTAANPCLSLPLEDRWMNLLKSQCTMGGQASGIRKLFGIMLEY